MVHLLFLLFLLKTVVFFLFLDEKTEV